MTDLGRVLVLAGGLSAEREVSLQSGARLRDALVRAGVDVHLRDVDAGLLGGLAAEPPAVVWPVLHGVSGEDGTLQEVLEMFGVPYVGGVPAGCRAAFDKPTAKALLASAGVRTPASVCLPRDAFADLGAGALVERIVARLGLPLVVKPRAGGSAMGVSVVRDAADLPAALMAATGYHDWILVEQAITGDEITVGVVDLDGAPVALPAVGIAPHGGAYDYAARYTAGGATFTTPADLAPAVSDVAGQVALTAHRLLGLRDLSRTDMIVDGDGVVWYLETNVAPGQTATSTWPLGLAATGRDLGVVYRDLAAAAAHRAG
ncbi:D-alanine--D-alanine ligase [Frankia sp. AgKG'84/4]